VRASVEAEGKAPLRRAAQTGGGALEHERTNARRTPPTPGDWRVVRVTALAALLQGLCTAPRGKPALTFGGTLETKIDGVPVDEPATVQVAGTTGAVDVSIAPEGGSESSCLLGARG
jgi:hypothetical protein